MNKRAFAIASAAFALLAASAQAYTIDDEGPTAYWGAGLTDHPNTGLYDDPGSSGDVYDPGSVADTNPEGYAINSMGVSYTKGELTVTIYSNTYFDNWVSSSLTAGPGSLFLSTNGWNPDRTSQYFGSDGTYNADGNGNQIQTGEIWEYAITLNNSVNSDGTITKNNGSAVLNGTASLYSVSADSIKFGTARTAQEAYYSPANQTALNQEGRWKYEQQDNGDYALVITMSIGDIWDGSKDLGLHWTMLCANDVVEGSIPGNPVPEPGTLALFAVGALGLAAAGRRRRS